MTTEKLFKVIGTWKRPPWMSLTIKNNNSGQIIIRVHPEDTDLPSKAYFIQTEVNNRKTSRTHVLKNDEDCKPQVVREKILNFARTKRQERNKKPREKEATFNWRQEILNVA